MMKNKQLLLILILATLVACSKKDAGNSAEAPASQPAPVAEKAPANKAADKPADKVATAGVAFVSLKEGAQIGTETEVNFSVNGKSIRPAGEAPEEKTTGHHHVIIDGAAMAEGAVIPMDAKHLHFGKGQTQTVLKLTPGAHTLTLQFADGAHRSYGPAWSQTIKVMVSAAVPASDAAVAPATAPKTTK